MVSFVTRGLPGESQEKTGVGRLLQTRRSDSSNPSEFQGEEHVSTDALHYSEKRGGFQGGSLEYGVRNS